MRIAGQWLARRLKRRLLDAVDRCDLLAIEHRCLGIDPARLWIGIGSGQLRRRAVDLGRDLGRLMSVEGGERRRRARAAVQPRRDAPKVSRPEAAGSSFDHSEWYPSCSQRAARSHVRVALRCLR
jgi:hypothetical protein